MGFHESVDCPCKGPRGNGDIRVEHPYNVVFCLGVGSDEVVDFGIDANVLLT